MISAVAALALSSACGGAAEVDATGPNPADSDAAASDDASSGADGAEDSGAVAAASPFADAPAYVPTAGRNTFKPGEHPGNGNPTKRACFDCHGGSGPGPEFFAAGRFTQVRAMPRRPTR